jgi:acetyl-CoA carboxylase carboxyltransferase component
MGGEQAADVLVTVKNDQLVREGQQPIQPDFAEAIRKPIVEKSREQGNALYSTANLWDDGIVDPAKTRDVLGLAISVSLNAPLDGRDQGHGTFRM